MSEIALVKQEDAITVRECLSAEEAQACLNEMMVQKGLALLAQAYPVIDGKQTYVFVFVRPPDQRVGRGIAVPEIVMRKN